LGYSSKKPSGKTPFLSFWRASARSMAVEKGWKSSKRIMPSE
jgi:hypothetical protein